MLLIRRPTLHDLNECVRLDASFTTQRVWQLNLQLESTSILVHFQLVQLPRPITVEAPPISDNLLVPWKRGDCMLAAQLDRDLVGFIHMIPEPEIGSGLIHRHVVAPEHRRQGIGARLLQHTLEWARQRSLRSLRVQLSVKNHPATAFYLAHGFSFSGFNEGLHPDQEIILELTRPVR
ncbi:MAG: GNAT family N-acetyltransferase [Chloroflexi bacterium]|nr:GNAT family N-acetyltransferase [Chloroflexota bacterium]